MVTGVMPKLLDSQVFPPTHSAYSDHLILINLASKKKIPMNSIWGRFMTMNHFGASGGKQDYDQISSQSLSSIPGVTSSMYWPLSMTSSHSYGLRTNLNPTAL